MLNGLFGRGSDESEDEADAATDGGAALFDEMDDGIDDIGGLGGLEDDDVFGEMGGDDGDRATQELDRRIDEMENELAGMSSSVNTVKRENEEISSSLDEIEENVRKLLDIYEMVTRGVNPFVDEAEPTVKEGTSFGVFQSESSEDSGDEALDDSVVGAEAESFFEDEIDEPVVEDEPAPNTVDPSPNELELDGSGGDSGTSFEELKAEYESGTADWSDGNGRDRPAESDVTSTSRTPTVEPAPPADRSVTANEPSGGANESDGDLQLVEDTLAGTADRAAKPYLRSIPEGYIGDLLVMDWLKYLVEESDPADAKRALRYYVSIDWVDDDVAAHLETFLRGFAGGQESSTDDAVEGGDSVAPVALTMDHHTQSLRYICHLTNDTPGSVVLNGNAGRRPASKGDGG